MIIPLIAVSIITALVVGLWLGTRYPRILHCELRATSVLATEGVGAYRDRSLHYAVGRIDWGDILEASNSVTLHLQNVVDVGIMPSLSSTNWEPVGISDYASLEWNYDGSIIHPDERREVTLTLTVPESSSFACYLDENEVENCTFNIVIRPELVYCQLPISQETHFNDILPDSIPNYSLKFLHRDAAYERITGQDTFLVYEYIPTNDSNLTVYTMINVADSLATLSMRGWSDSPFWAVLDEKDTQLLEDVPIIAHYLTVGSTSAHFNQVQIMLYWYAEAHFNNGATNETKIIKTTVTIITENAENLQEFEDTLYTLAQTIVLHWEPYRHHQFLKL